MSSLEQNGKDSSDIRRINPTVPVCRTLNDFEIIDQLGEGTFGLVYKAREKVSGEVLALKKIRMEKEKEGFPLTAIREIKILKRVNYKNVVNLKDVITGDNGDVYLVFEFIDHDLSGLFNQKPMEILKPEIIKSYMKQLLEGLNYLHVNKILHRDIKTSNLLISNNGILKLADFGLARPIKPENKARYTPDMITLWYRPPELLITLKEPISYSTEVDLWSVGCILAELLCRNPLFPGKNEMDQLDLILRLCGFPDEETINAIPSYKNVKLKEEYKPRLREELSKTIKDEYAIDLIEKLLSLHPGKRISAHEALDHDYFWNDPLPCPPEEIPYLGDSCHEFTSKKRTEKLKQMRMAKNPHNKEHRRHPYHSYQPNHNPHNRFQNYSNINNYKSQSASNVHQSNSNYQRSQPKKSNYQSYFRKL